MAEHTPAQVIRKIAECAAAMSFQSGEPGMEIAGQTLSHLAAHPEEIERFMDEGNELWIDGTINAGSGCLTYRCMDGAVRRPSTHRTEQ